MMRFSADTQERKSKPRKRSGKGCTLKHESGSKRVDFPSWTSAGNIARPSSFLFFFFNHVSQINSVIFALQVNFLEQTIVCAWNAQIKRWDFCTD